MKIVTIFWAFLLFSFSEYALAVCDQVRTLPDRFVGIHINYAAASLRWPGESDASIPRHVGALRLWDSYGATWRDLEPSKGAWNFKYLDHYLSLASSSGVDVVLTLGMTPRWASAAPDQLALHGPGSAAPPANLDDWENYVRVVAKRYRGKISYYEIWNEPAFSDLEKVISPSGQAGFFSGSSNEMVEMARRATRAIREEDPNARVISPSMAGHYQGLKRLERFLVNGGAGLFDILGFHYYQTDTHRPENLPKLIKRVEDLAKAHNFLGPIWNTEMGLVIQPPDKTVKALEPGSPGALGRVFKSDESAGILARYLLVGAACGLERFYWLAWDNGSMGLTYKDGGKIRKPHRGGTAFSNMAKWLSSADIGPCKQSKDIWVCQMTSPTLGKGQWVWHTGEENLRVERSLFGQFRRIVHVDGSITVPESGSLTLFPEPVFLVD